MKILASILFIGIFFISSCTKEGETSMEILTDTIDTVSSKIIASGNFVSSSGKSVSGKALLLLKGSTYTLALENFSSTNGPDLFLYLSKQVTPYGIINVGILKSTNGNQVYSVPAIVNANEYKYVIVYCKQFSTPFGVAEIK